MEINWNCNNQTMKILKRLYYEKTGMGELFKWNDEESIDLQDWEIDIEKYSETVKKVIVNIAIYLSAFDEPEFIERMKSSACNDNADDYEAENKQIEDVLLNDVGLLTLNQITDKLLAFSLLVFLCNEDNLSDEGKNANRLSECFYQIVTYFIDIKRKNQFRKADDCFDSEQDINTDELEIGDIIRNYKELCKLTGQDIKTGKSRQLQLEDFKRYFEWEKSGQKFIITDVYDTPLSKEDKRKLGNNSIYVKCIEVILLQYLSKQEKFTRTFTKRNWWELLGMINHKYKKVTQDYLKRLDYSVTTYEIKHFYQRCNKKLEQVLFSALNSLQNRKLILYEKQTVIVKSEKGSTAEQYFLADDIDKKRILREERYVLKNVMGYEKMIQVYCRFKQDEFYRKVNERLNELYGWNFYFKQIKVIFTQEDIIEALPQVEIELQKEILNNKIIDCLSSNAKDYYSKEREKWKIPDVYLMAQHILTDELIKIGNHNIVFSREQFDAELDDLFMLTE